MLEGKSTIAGDLRLRWTAEEAGLDYTVRTVAVEDRETNHLDRQPSGQIPFLADVLRVALLCAFGDRPATKAYTAALADPTATA